MNKKNHIIPLAAGILTGAMLTSTAGAAVNYVKAYRSDQPIYLDGEKIDCRTYNIEDQNYIRLADLCGALGVGCYWDSATNSVYLGKRYQPVMAGIVTLPTDGSKYIPKAGDKLLCDDGYIYEITDVSRWENNVFSPDSLPNLPSPTCDWSRFPEVELPPVEVRHFSHPGKESVFVRNLYETRRMQYTIYNTLGQEPSVWRNGKLLASVSLSISPEDEDLVRASWPWCSSDLENLVHSRPNSRFSIEAWDYYSKGIFQYTRYCVVSL